MGNLCTCLPSDQPPADRRLPGQGIPNSSRRSNQLKSSTRSHTSAADIKMDDPVLREQARAAAAVILQQYRRQNASGASLPFDRSASLRCPPRVGSTKNQQVALPRSCSARPRSVADRVIQPHRLVNQGKSVENSEVLHFVLVHGGGFGAWCWYKTIALLQEGGFKVTAIDLTGSGVNLFDTNKISSLSQYVEPLTEFLDKLPDGEKVILVGHDLGGACLSVVMELAPQKISKAVFVAAAMLRSGQSTLELFSQKGEGTEVMGKAQKLLYANGRDQPPTAIDLDRSLLRDLMFNQCSTKDVALASVSMRAIPFPPVLEKLSLSDQNYGSVSRFYIQTPEDCAIPITLQEQMVKSSPPEQVFYIKGADHSPFFSKPQALHRLLVEISKL